MVSTEETTGEGSEDITLIERESLCSFNGSNSKHDTVEILLKLTHSLLSTILHLEYADSGAIPINLQA